MKKLKLLIDCNALCYRAFHSLPKNMKFGDKDTNIIYGFLNQIRKLAEDFQSDQFIFCWDSARSYRKLAYPWYKEKRHKDMTDQERKNLHIAYHQFRDIQEIVLPCMGFRNIYSQNGYEGDDWIGFFALRFPDNYLIVTNDEDMFQLLERGPQTETRIYNHKSVKTIDDFLKGTGLQNARQWILVKAIAGCKTDEIEGIEGAGEDKAIQYVRHILPEGKVLERIKNNWNDIVVRNINLIHLPYTQGIRGIGEDINAIPEDELYVIDFMETFRDFGCASFLGDGLEKWKKVFKLKSGSRR